MSVLTKGQRAVNHWIMVELVAQKTSTMYGPDGKKIETNEAYCRVLNISPGVDATKLGYVEGDLIAGPRIMWVPGLPKNIGQMSAGDVFYRMDELPDGIEPLSEAATVDDFINPGLGGMLSELKKEPEPIDPEVHP